MAKIKRWFMRLWCLLRGGCVYHDTNLQIQRDEINMVYKFQNRCIRCGKVSEWELPYECLFPSPKINPLYVYVEDGNENGSNL